MEVVKIDTEFIKLGQFLKLCGIADQGSYAKIFIQDGLVKVNGVVDTRRGRKVYPGDIVVFDDTNEFEVKSNESE